MGDKSPKSKNRNNKQKARAQEQAKSKAATKQAPSEPSIGKGSGAKK